MISEPRNLWRYFINMSENVQDTYEPLWRRFGLATHYDYNFRQFQRKWFMERFNLDEDSFHALIDGKTILEVGTGAGAFLNNLLSAKTIVGVDISEVGTKIASRMYATIPRVKVITEDIFKYDGWPVGLYDVVIADQVLHHLPDTFKGLEKAVSLTKPGGTVLFYVYKKKPWVREFMDTFLRIFTTRMPLGWCLNFSKVTCWLGKTLTRINLPFQRWVYRNIVKCFWNEEFSYDNNLRINFDWYSPKIAHRYTKDEVFAWIIKLGLTMEYIQEGMSGFSVRAIVEDQKETS